MTPDELRHIVDMAGTRAAFARMMKCDQRSVYQWLAEDRGITPATAKKALAVKKGLERRREAAT